MKYLNYEKRRFRFRFSINKCTPLEKKKKENREGKHLLYLDN